MYVSSRMKTVMKMLFSEGPATFDEVSAELGGDELSTVVTLNDLSMAHFVKPKGEPVESKRYHLTERGLRYTESWLREMN